MGRESRKKRAAARVAEPEGDTRPGEGGGRPGWITMALVVILAAAALFRVAYFFQYRAESVFYGETILDATIYDQWARRIAGGEIRPPDPFYFAPGYPYALGLLYALVSPEKGAVFLCQLLLGLLNIFLIHRLAWAAFGSRAAPFAAALAALYASFPFLEMKVMSAILALTLLLLAMVALAEASARSRAWLWAAGGLLLGLTSLVRPETLLAGPFVLAWLMLWGAPLKKRGARTLDWKGALPAAALVAAGWALTLVPVVAHNVQRGGGTTLISSQGGITFYQSNNPRARGLYVFLSREGFSGAPDRQAQEEKRIAERETGRSLSTGEVSGYWFGKGVDFILSQPGRFVWLLGMKLLRYVGSYEYSTEYILYVERETVWILWAAFVPFALLVALSTPTLFGVLRSAGRGPRGGGAAPLNATGWLVLLMLAANLAACLTFYISSRYRLPSAPLLMIFSGASLAAGLEAFRRRRWAGLAATGALVAVLFLVAHLEKDQSATIQEANVHFNTGNVWGRLKNYEKAAAEYERAVEMDDSRHSLWYNLGNTYRALGREADAAVAYGMAGKRRPRFIWAHLRQGASYVKLKEWRNAREAYRRAEKLRPDRFDVHLALGRIALALGDRGEAALHLDRALEIRPGSEAALREKAKL
jgi:tetratricopeptide (TPR) repeat protein